MAIQERDFTLNFSGTIDTKSDPNQVSPNNFLSLNNSVFTTGGRLTKRNGFPSLGTVVNPSPVSLSYSNLGVAISDARKVFAYQNELCVNDGFNLYSYSQSDNTWDYKGRSTIVGLSTSNIAQDNVSKSQMDVSIDTTTGIKVFAWAETDLTVVRYSIQDSSTGQFIVNKRIFGNTYTNPRCVSIAGKSWVFAVNTVDGKLYYQAIVGKTITGVPTALVTDLSAANKYYDVGVSAGNIYLTYFTNGPGIKIEQLSSSLVIVNSITKAGESATHGLSFFGDGTNIWVVYNNGTQTKAFIVNNAVTATVQAPYIIDGTATAANVMNVTGTWSSTLSLAFIFYDNTDDAIYFNTSTVGASVGTPKQFMRSVNITSKAFSVNGIPHILTVFLNDANFVTSAFQEQKTYFLLNLYNVTPTMGVVPFGDVVANIAAKIQPDQAGASRPLHGVMCSANNPSGSIWEFAISQNTILSQAGITPNSIYFIPGVMDCQFDFSLSNPDVQVLGNDAQIASGEVIMYDGASVVEQNFHIFPVILGGNSSNVGGFMGSPTANTLYSYQATYEWQDNQGQLHRSSPSPVKTIDNGSGYTFASGTITGSVQLEISYLRATNKSGVLVKIYRTTGNGSIYYLVNTLFAETPNNPQSDSFLYTDTLPDGVIIGNLQLYTTGELEDYAPPASRAMSNFKNRILTVDAEGGSTFGFSKQVEPGFPVEFVPEFIQNVGTVGGPLTAIAGMDDKIVLFKSGLAAGPSILYMVGTGPSASGANNDFTDPLPVAVDCGCVNRSSIALTPNGLIFKSDKGIYQLDRSLQASYIGAPVEGYNQYNVVSSQLIPNTTQVRFLLSNGTLLMYDYFYAKWATFSNPAGISDCIFQGQHTYVASNGVVYKESPGVYYDGTNTPILMSFQTANLNLAGISGYERIYGFIFMGEYISPHQIDLQIGYDYQAPSQGAVITPNSFRNLEQWKIDTKRQLCQSFQITFTEVYTGSLGASLTMSGITFKLGIKKGLRPIRGSSSTGLS